MICKHCGKENEDSCLYCIQCGMKLTADESSKVKKFCPKCGTENVNNTTVCVSCGNSLKEEDKSANVDYAYADPIDYVYSNNVNQAPPSNTPMILSIISLCVSLLCCCVPFVSPNENR